jgi:hypothetical protein
MMSAHRTTGVGVTSISNQPCCGVALSAATVSLIASNVVRASDS